MPKADRLAIAHRLCATGRGTDWNIRRRHPVAGKNLAQSTGMLSFDMSQEYRIEMSNFVRPHGVKRCHPGARIEKNRSRRTALSHEIGIHHADAMRHRQRPDTEGQSSNGRKGIVARTEGAEPHLVQVQDSGDSAQLVARKIGTIVDGIKDSAQRHFGPQRQEFARDPGLPYCLVQHVAEFIFEGKYGSFRHGEAP